MKMTNEIMNRKREERTDDHIQSPQNATTYYRSEYSQAWALLAASKIK